MGQYDRPVRHIVIHIREADQGVLFSPVYFDLVRGRRTNARVGAWKTVPWAEELVTLADYLRALANLLDAR